MPKAKIVGSKVKKMEMDKKVKTNKKTAPADGGIKEAKKRRFKPGTLAFREIKKY
eukprot:CAMPEP_0116879618 /NCGR_PEP_ID=MMETSP0463-20121206/11435_1 /TAXON_ID=181622 /ORGANISM="Strombidinopsis sp, Strain SopsisLIS2011" /LENGTH=54 /DNA_ID=CAMNT_0004529153 /DNA_START=46 /DNA_END=210 /DNA_ORIENTATION=-